MHCGSVIRPRSHGPALASLVVPIRTVTESNANGSWVGKHERANAQIGAVTLMLRAHVRKVPSPPLHVVVTRIAPRDLDPDNRVSSQKHVIDAISRWLGVDDGDARVTYQVQAERGRPKQYAVRIDMYQREVAL